MRENVELCITELKERGVEVRENVLMKDLTTIGVGGKVEIFAVVKSEWESVVVQSACKKFRLPQVVLGRGSNVIASDKGVSGVVMQFADKFGKIERVDDFVFVRGNVKMSSLINFAYQNNLGGVEEFVGIPSSVLGLVRMNGGAYGKDMSQIVECVTAEKEGEEKCILANNCNFEYRHSRFFDSGEIISAVTLRLHESDKSEIKQKMQTYINARKKTQPIFKLTCGSVFKNPLGEFAGKLIEQVGLKGFEVNGVRISNKHANFIENFNCGKCDDILKIIDIAREMVYNTFKIQLETEVQFME